MQQEILTAISKLFLNDPEAGHPLIQELFKQIEVTEDPDLRLRGYFYRRLLAKDPEKSIEIICQQRPVIRDSSVDFDKKFASTLLEFIGYVHSSMFLPISV